LIQSRAAATPCRSQPAARPRACCGCRSSPAIQWCDVFELRKFLSAPLRWRHLEKWRRAGPSLLELHRYAAWIPLRSSAGQPCPRSVSSEGQTRIAKSLITFRVSPDRSSVGLDARVEEYLNIQERQVRLAFYRNVRPREGVAKGRWNGESPWCSVRIAKLI